jgi:hypothetical protein
MNNLKYRDGSTTYVESLEKKIAELEKQIVVIEKNTDYWVDKANCIKNNEPVSWMDTEGGFYSAEDYQVCLMHNLKEVLTPLYTHPVKEQLTDEEINVVAILQDAEIVPVGHEIWKTDEEFNKYKKIVLATAKALRKAQE